MSFGNFGKYTFRAYLVVLATIFLVAPRGVKAQDCDQWTRIASPNAVADATFLGGVSGIADDDVWSVGWYRMEHPSVYDEFPYALHWDGQQWNNVFVPEPPIGLDHKTRLYDVTAVSENEVWTVGNYIPPENVNAAETLVMQWNGDQWEVIPSPTAQIGSGSSFYAIDSKDGEVWAVGSSLGTAGQDNLAARWNGSGWDEYYPVRINNGDHQLNSVHIHSDSLVFAAGGVGPLSIPYVARWDGSSWSEVLPRIDSDFYLGLTSIISFGPNDVWVGASRTENFQFQYFVYLHYDGNSWTEYPVVDPFHVPSFEGDDPNNFYSGGFGTLAKFNGKAWELVDSLAVDVWTINDITVLPSGTVFGSGNTYDTGSPETLTARYVPCVHAHWTVSSLHPASLQSSEARGASGSVQVGNYYTGTERACLWTGTAASWVNLDPAGSLESMALGASDANQVGWADVAGRRRASLWSGTAASWMDLNPAGALQSQALGAWGGNQVGWMYDGVIGRASLWSGNAESWVDLHPAGTTGSQASAVWGGNQIGWAVVNGVFHASLWSGTAESWVDLHPVGAFQSEAKGISEDYQVGIVDGHASLWSGTAASWVDLNPAETNSSELRAASGPLQVGAARVDGWDHASVWSGTAESWVDLHALLSADFRYSYALAVTSDGVSYYVTGLGYNTFEGRFEALLWTQPVAVPTVVAPSLLTVTSGAYIAGDESSLAASDNVDLALQRSNSDVQSRTEFEVLGTSPTASPTSLEVTLEGAVFARSTVVQTIELWDYFAGDWELVDTRNATNMVDSTATVAATGDLSRFVDQTAFAVKARVHFQSLSARQRFASNTDQFLWTIGQ